MAYNFREYNQGQMYLIPPSMAEWLPEKHLARFVDETVEGLDVSNFYESYRSDGWGNTAYHPKMLVKIMLYSYCIGVSSSRKISQQCEDQISYRYLSGNQLPDFRTINRFRRKHRIELKGLFVKILGLCREAGLAKMGTVSLDGTKLKANAALEANRELASINREIDRMMKEADANDKKEDKKFGKDLRGDELPEVLQTRKGRFEQLQKAKKKLEEQDAERIQKHEEKLTERQAEETTSGLKKRGRKPKSPPPQEGKINMTDPESRIMKSRSGFVQGYNGQAMVDCASQIIVAQALTQDCNDKKQLEPMLAIATSQNGILPSKILVDAGYWSEANAKLETPQTELLIAVSKDWKQRKALQELPSPRGRIPKNSSLSQLMERKLLTKRGRSLYRLRGQTVEPVFGQIKGRGLGNLRLRGTDGAELEWSLYCATHNLLKLWRNMLKMTHRN